VVQQDVVFAYRGKDIANVLTVEEPAGVMGDHPSPFRSGRSIA